MWEAIAEYSDGTRIEKQFPYVEEGDYTRENERQYEIECWLIEQHEGCTYYSVGYDGWDKWECEPTRDDWDEDYE